MATTVANMSCAQEMLGRPHSKRVQELTYVITRYLPYLHRMALRRLDNVEDAEDAVQDALLSALTHVDQFRGQAQMSTWLTAILINSVRIKLRQRPRRVHIPLDEKDLERDELSSSQVVPDHRPGPEDICRWWELTELLFRLMKRLSPTLRRTFQLRAVDGLSIRETATFYGFQRALQRFAWREPAQGSSRWWRNTSAEIEQELQACSFGIADDVARRKYQR